MAVCQNRVPLVNIKIAGKWMFIPLKMVCIGIDPYPNGCLLFFSWRVLSCSVHFPTGTTGHHGSPFGHPLGTEGSLQWLRARPYRGYSEIRLSGCNLSNPVKIYPLVNVYITMENHHFSWENPLFLWPFSIAM